MVLIRILLQFLTFEWKWKKNTNRNNQQQFLKVTRFDNFCSERYRYHCLTPLLMDYSIWIHLAEISYKYSIVLCLQFRHHCLLFLVQTFLYFICRRPSFARFGDGRCVDCTCIISSRCCRLPEWSLQFSFFFLGGFAINGMCLVVLVSVFQVPSPWSYPWMSAL